MKKYGFLELGFGSGEKIWVFEVRVWFRREEGIWGVWLKERIRDLGGLIQHRRNDFG